MTKRTPEPDFSQGASGPALGPEGGGCPHGQPGMINIIGTADETYGRRTGAGQYFTVNQAHLGCWGMQGSKE